MNSRRPGGKLEAGLRPALHFLGDFGEIPSIYFIMRRPRRRSFQNDFVNGMELSFVFHRASATRKIRVAPAREGCSMGQTALSVTSRTYRGLPGALCSGREGIASALVVTAKAPAPALA